MAGFPRDGAAEAFRDFAGRPPTDMTLAEGLRAMLDFYETVPPDGPVEPAAEGGDALLFQYGTYDWGLGDAFEVDLTRQVIYADAEDDDALFQLNLTYRYPPKPAFRTLESGEQWFFAIPDEAPFHGDLAKFRKFVLDHPVLAAIGARSARSVDVTWGGV